MRSKLPQVSVIIPAYNQAQYLPEAIESVLAQTYKNFEIIVVDDGSTDETPLLAKRFSQVIRYIYQENQGLAGARNTGILAAQGEYVALLDSDDAWLPAFLEKLMALAAQQPEATVYYCGVQYIDQDGAALPQAANVWAFPPGQVYFRMLRANFLVPSTIVMRRPAVMAAGLFDVAFRRLQDWELWVRLLRTGHSFVGLPEALVRYRIHGSSLSTDPVGGQQAALAIAQKHFGPDDGRWQTWSEDKRRAYGGLYRYYALTSSLLRQNDWQACARHLQRAFQADPTLAVDIDLFYELNLGTQPLGQRETSQQLNLVESAARIEEVLATVFDRPPVPGLEQTRSRAYGTAYYALGLVAYNSKQYRLSRRFLLTALRFRPALWRNTRLLTTFVKSCLGRSSMDFLRQLRGATRQTMKNTV